MLWCYYEDDDSIEIKKRSRKNIKTLKNVKKRGKNKKKTFISAE